VTPTIGKTSLKTLEHFIIRRALRLTLRTDGVAAIYWIEWGLFVYLAFKDWKFAAFVFVLKFLLKVLPVLEFFGNILMRPFKK
jgi:hypothetical protein